MSRGIAFLIIVFGAPIFVFISMLVLIDSPGPIIFRQRRIGKKNKEFIIFKFRTMCVGTPDLPSDQVPATDCRITRIGKFLRRLSLDEIPQLWNIIIGDMVFVGPRPALYNQYELNSLRKQRGIDTLKPGITGWAQVNGRDSISDEQKVNLDEYYLKNANWLLDFRIIWLTLFKTAVGEGLYGRR